MVSMSGHDIYQAMKTKAKGTHGLHGAATEAADMQNVVNGVADDLHKYQQKLQAACQGKAAEAAAQAPNPVVQRMDQYQQHFSQHNRALQNQAYQFEYNQGQLTNVPAQQPMPNMLQAFTGTYGLSYLVDKYEFDGQNDQNKQAYMEYMDCSGKNGNDLPAQYDLSPLPAPNTGGGGPNGPVPGGGGGHHGPGGPTGPGPAGPGGPGGPMPGGPGGTGGPVSGPVPHGGGYGPPPVGGGGPQGGGGSGMPVHGYQPMMPPGTSTQGFDPSSLPSNSWGGLGGGGSWGGPSGGYGSGFDSGAGVGGLSAGFGAGGFGVGGGGAGSGAGGGVGGGSRGFGAGGEGQLGRGAASGAGAGAGASAAEGMAGRGAAGARGAGGMGGMPGGGARGKGDEDTEHDTPSYLISEQQGHAIIGELPETAPPVIGE